MRTGVRSCSTAKRFWTHRSLVLVLLLLLECEPTLARACAASDLLVPDPMRSDFYKCAEECHLPSRGSRVCNPDGLLTRPEAKAVDRLVRLVAGGGGNYTLGLTGAGGSRTRGWYIVVFILREVSAKSARAFAEHAYARWALLRCGEPRRRDCSNSVVLAVSTKRKGVSAYAGRSDQVVAMAGDLTRVEEEMKAELRLWRDDALSTYVCCLSLLSLVRRG